VNFKIEFDREDDGRWIAEIPELPGVMAYGTSKDEAEAAVEALALRVIARTIVGVPILNESPKRSVRDQRALELIWNRRRGSPRP
jgi:predicted RNase H-like HicB family nuclease